MKTKNEAAGDLPLSGYAIVKVYLTTAQLKPKAPTAPELADPPVTFGWDWRRTQDKSVFEVRLSLELEPVKERPYFAAVDAVGRFRQVGDSPSPPVEQFSALQAVAILLPYARQHLTNLTANTPPGPYYLPSINVHKLMESFDVLKTTAAQQDAEANAPRGVQAREHAPRRTRRSLKPRVHT